MKWALVCEGSYNIQVYNEGNETSPPGWVTVTVDPGTVVNIIIYDGVSPYSPPTGTYLLEVEDGVNVGDKIITGE